MIAGACLCRLALALAMGCAALPCAALDLALPSTARETEESDTSPDSYGMPIGSFADGTLPVLMIEGRVIRRSWRIASRGLTTLQVLSPLRDQLIAEGYEPVFECSDKDCGGFDFRYALEVIQDPAMHVDLFDYRVLTARRETAVGDSYALLLVSRTNGAGYVQLVLAGPEAAVAPPSLSTEPVSGSGIAVAQTIFATPLAERLEREGHAVLGDLEFATGSSQLNEGTYASLSALADYLKADPERRVALVGHTDTEGSLEGNIALSKRRAQSVLERLVSRHDVARGQLTAGGMGFLSPVASNLTPEGRVRNRRVEAVLLNTEPPDGR